MLLSRILLLTLMLAVSSFTYADVLLKDNNGIDIPFSTLKGKWVFINYWAGWCPTCVDEIPQFNRFYEQHKKDEVALFAVNFDGLTLAEQNSLIKRFNIRYPSLVQDPREVLQLGDIRGIPATFVFNPNGELVTTLYGGQTVKSLNKVMQPS